MTNEALATALGLSWTITDGFVVPSTTNQYYISSAAEWNAFATALSNGISFSGRTVNLTADIPTAEEIASGTTAVTTMAGTNDTPFAGIFNGQGHTLTVSIVSNELSIAPFRFADGATFKNLKTDGTVNASSKFAAGMLAETKNHSCSFINCISNVTITSSVSGDGTHGGFVAYLHTGNTTFEGCAFTGKLLGANTTHCGGFVGFTDGRYNASVSFTNCVFHPQQVTMSGTSSQTFARWHNNNSGSVTIGNNCYYSEAFGNAQGKQMHPITGGEYVTVAFSGNATPYELSGIDAYSVGIVYDSTLYAGNGETVSLNLSCTPPTGYVCSGYTTSAGTLTGTANPYTLTMPNVAVTIQAVLDQSTNPVAYIDENGVQQQCTSYTVVTNNLDFGNLPAGWYVVNDSITLNDGVYFSGDAHLILCDGATMNISCYDGHALYTYGSLTLYGQSEGTGSLTATSYHTCGIDVYENLTINGGTVNATGDLSGIFIEKASGYVTINGGTVTTNEIFSPTVTLGWSDTNDSITVGNFAYDDPLTVSVKSGQAFYYIEESGGTVVIRGTLDEDQISTIGGKTLFPYVPPVAYIDENGEEQECTIYTFVTDDLDFDDLPAGWYVVNDDITLDGWVHFSGDAHLILCDGATMNISNNFDALQADGDLTLYGQSGGTGSLSATSDQSDGISPTNLTINGCAVTATSNDSNGINATNLTINGSTVTATGSSNGISSIDLTINGSTVTASANDDGGMGISANRVTINSGTVNATGNESGIYIGNEYGYVTINGGTVTVTGDYGIYSPTVTLGWSILTDSITVGNFDYFDSPTVSVKSGQAFYYQNGNDTVVISGTLNENQISAIGGKTLFPYLPPVAYIDENGVEQECTSYSFVTEDLDFGNLPAGWYVVSNDITFNSNVYFTGDAHLILCDGATMNISIDDGDALYADGSLTLYGQSGGTGSLSATYTGYYGWFSDIYAPNLTINGGTVTATGKGIFAEDLTINGGTVTATATDGESGIYTDNLTINGGTITATGGEYGIEAIYLTINGGTVTATGSESGISISDLTVNGGTVTATSSNYGIEAILVIINGGTVTATGDYGIYAPSVNLGWSNLNDSITVSSFAYVDTPLVKVKGGQTFYYIDNKEKYTINTVLISGTLTAEEIEAIGGKTLRPYIEPCITPFDLEVTDIGATTATLHWTGFQDSYNVGYRTAEPAGEWVVATANTTTLNLTNLEPETEYEWLVQGIDCDGNGGTTEWSEWAFFTTMAGINFAVTGYGQGNGGYYLIASPCGETNPLNVTNLLSGNHDLYAFVPNPSDSLEWRNYATDTFNLEAGKGYLYANADTVSLTFNGTPYSGNGEFALVYDATDARKCWNLVGNPFPCAAYLDRPYYVLNAVGTGIDPEPIPASVPVQPCTAVFVKAVGVNDRAVFSVTAQP